MNLLYHATFRTNLSGIKKYGLGYKQPKNWEFSEDGVVCFTNNPDAAFSFCECAEDVPDYKYESGIIVLAIEPAILDVRLVSVDNNIYLDDVSNDKFYTYRGIIAPQNIWIAKSDKGIVGRMLELNRIPSYE